MDKETLKKVLAEFVATVNSNTSQTEDEILSKFPELKGYDKNVLGEFVATVNSNKSQTEDEILSKFPELTANMAKPINEPQKKKVGPIAMESSLGGGLLASTGTEQPVKSVTETVAPVIGLMKPQQQEVQAPLVPQTPVQKMTEYFQEQPVQGEGERERQEISKRISEYSEKLKRGEISAAQFVQLVNYEKGQKISSYTDEEIIAAYQKAQKEKDPGLFFSSTPSQYLHGTYSTPEGVPQEIQEALRQRQEKLKKGDITSEEILKKIKADEEKEFKLSNQAALQNPEFAQLLNIIDDKYIQKGEEDAVKELNEKFSKYGLHFAQSGAGSYVTVRTADGLNEMEFKFGDRNRDYSSYADAYPDISSNRAALKRFIVENARNPEELKIENEDYLTKALKARELRRVPMISEDGERSTVRFTSVEVDGKNYVIPTLFPKNPTSYTSNPQDWMEILDVEDAFAEAKKRGEVFQFDNKEDANRFAEGEWKDIGIHDLEGKKFYEARGLDYMAEKRKWDEYNKVQDELDVMNAMLNGKFEDISPAERMRYPHLFGSDGKPLYIYGTGSKSFNQRYNELKGRRNSLIEQTHDEAFDAMYNMGLSSKSDSGPVQKAREDFDLFLEKRRSEEVANAVKTNLFAKEQYDLVNGISQNSFGVPLSEIDNVVPKTEDEANAIDQIRREKVRIEYMRDIASTNYENASLYYDRKWNKKVSEDYAENVSAFINSAKQGWYRGKAADAIWWAALGVYDVEEQGSREELSQKISEYFKLSQEGPESRVWARYETGREGTGMKTFLTDPFEFISTVAVTSFAQMLPLGFKIVPATTTTGAATGAAIGGVTGGPIGAGAGFITGGGYGFGTGVAATSFALEYSNAIFDVMGQKINPATGYPYDITNPKDVEAALMNQEVWDEGHDRGLKRGIPIAIVDFLGGRLAGRVFNVAKTAPITMRTGALIAERFVVDPIAEGLGEYAAQVVSGDDVNMNEVILEMIGGPGQQAPMMSLNLLKKSYNNELTAHAYNLTDINNLAMETTSDERITSWVNNMKRLGKIDDDVSQRVLENVGLRREARELLGTTKSTLGIKSNATREVESRVMQLLAAKKEMSSTDSRKAIFGEKIKAVNNELATIAETGKMVPESERSNFEVFSAFTQREGVSNYKIDGRTLTKKQFDTWMENATKRRLLKSRVQVLNDEDTKQKYEEKVYAILKQKTGQVPVLSETGISETVEGRAPEAEFEGVTREGVQAEETLTEATPEQNETEAISQDIESSRTRLEELNDLIPQPLSQIGKSVTDRFQQGQMNEQETQSLFSTLADRLNNKKKLTDAQQAVYDANKERVDEIRGLVSERNDLNTEVSELESIIESRESKQSFKPTEAADFTVEEALDEDGEVDYEAEQQVRAIARERNLGITSDREIAFVARNENGDVIGGAFRSFDPQTKKYTFDVVVSQEAEGRGAGSRLLDAVRQVPMDVREAVPGTKVEVDVVNPAMQEMLRRRGYVVTKRLGGDRVLMAPRKAKKAAKPTKPKQTVSAKSQTDVESLSLRSTQNKRRIISQAVRAINVLSKILPDLEIFIHETREEYNDTVSKLNGRENSAGNFAIIGRGPNQKLRIDINLSVANENTVAHEVAHAVMMKAFGENVKLFKSFRNQISKILSDSTNEQLNQFASRYSEAESHEEFLVEFAALLSNNPKALGQSLVQKIANAINDVVSKITGGRFVPFKGAVNARQIIDFMNTFATAMAEGIEISESDIQAIAQNLSVPIGNPVVISRSAIGNPVSFPKTPSSLSFVTDKYKFDFQSFLQDVIDTKKKVWFWMADQLGRGYYFDEAIGKEHYLDAGPSFALDPDNINKKVLWASGLSKKTLEKKIKNSDYIFFISGSPQKAKLFNKSVLNFIAQRINKKSDFNSFRDALNNFDGGRTKTLEKIVDILSNVNSFQELQDSPKRKEFLIAIDDINKLKTAKKGSLKALLSDFDVFIDLNEFRDGFYRENGFDQNDIMLVGKPTGVGGKAKHSTYEYEILGEVIGVPDVKVNSWDIMPKEIKDKYPSFKGRESETKSQQMKVIAAETGKVRKLEQIQGLEVVSKSQLPVDEQVKSMSSLLPDEIRTMQSIINIGRENGFSDSAIKEVLKSRGYKVRDIEAEMRVNIDPFTELPTAFTNVEGGVNEGLKLFREVRAQLATWIASQTRKPSDAKVRAMGVEFMKNNPIYKAQKQTTQMELTYAFDKSLGRPGGVRIQRVMDNIVNNLKSRVGGIKAKELQAAKIKLKNVINELLMSVDVVKSKNAQKILDILANSKENTILRDLERIMPMIEQERERMMKASIKEMVSLINEKAKKARTSTGKVRSKGIDSIGQSFFASAKSVLDAVLKNDEKKIAELQSLVDDAIADGRLADVLEKQEAGAELTSKEESIANIALALDMFQDIQSLDVEQVKDLIESLKMMRSESIKRLKVNKQIQASQYEFLRRQGENQARETMPVLFNPDGTPKTSDRLAQEQAQIWESFSKLKLFDAVKKLHARWKAQRGTGVKDFFMNNLAHLATICSSLDNPAKGRTFFTDNIYKPLNRAKELSLRGYYKQMSILDSMANTIPNVTKGYKQIKQMLSKLGMQEIEINGVKEKYSADKLLRIYALSLNDVQRKKLENMGWNQDKIDEVKKILGPELISFSERLVEYLSNDYFNSVNDVYRFVNNVNLGYVTNYFPTRTEPTKVSAELLRDGNFNGIFNAEVAPALKERKDVSGDVQLNFDFTDVVEDHFKSMERYKAYAWEVKKISAIFKNKSVDTFITQARIKPIMSQLVNYAITPSAGKANMRTILSDIINRYTGYALFGKLMQIPKQAISSFVNAYEDYSYFPEGSKVPGVIKSPVDLMMFALDSAVVMATLPKWSKMAYKESATFRERWEKGVEGDVYGLEGGGNIYIPIDKRGTKYAMARRAAKKAGAAPTMIGDALGVMGYMVNLRRNMINGMPLEKAVEVFNDYNATAQTRRETEKNILQVDNSDTSRAFTMFGSTTFLQMNKVFQSIDNVLKYVGAGKVPRRKDMRALALNLGISNALFIATSNIFRLMSGDKEDEEEVLQRIEASLLGAELLYQIPFFGWGFEYAMNYVNGDKRKPISDIVNPLQPVIKDAVKVYESGEPIKAVIPIIELAIGAQIDPVIGLYNAFSDGFNEDSMYDMLGVSKSYRPGFGQQKREKKEDTEELTKEEMKRYFPDEYNIIYRNPAVMKAEEFEKGYEKQVEEIERNAMDAAFGYKPKEKE
jgi:hypothetical protein